jgi:hypothetical protein
MRDGQGVGDSDCSQAPGWDTPLQPTTLTGSSWDWTDPGFLGVPQGPAFPEAPLSQRRRRRRAPRAIPNLQGFQWLHGEPGWP